MNIRKFKLLIIFVITICFSYTFYVKLNHSDKERIEIFFNEHKSEFTELAHSIMNKINDSTDKLLYNDTTKLFINAKNKLNIEYVYIFENKKIYFEMNLKICIFIFTYTIKNFEYRYYAYPFEEYMLKDGPTLYKIDEHWGFYYQSNSSFIIPF
jgi:hypothetical protein